MMKFLMAAVCATGFLLTPAIADTPTAPTNNCAVETQEQRLLDAFKEEPTREAVILQGSTVVEFMLKLGMPNDNQVDKIYIVKAKRPNEVIVFFLKDGCIVFVEQTLLKFVEKYFLEKTKDQEPTWQSETRPETIPSTLVVSGFDPGGVIATYATWWERVRDSGVYVKIDGACISACTLVLGIVPDDRICMTPRGSFGFHQAKIDGKPNQPLTEVLVRSLYPVWVQEWLKTKPALKDEPPLYAVHEDFKDHIKECTN